MSELPQVNERGLTAQQEEILTGVYGYVDSAEMTEEEFVLAEKMFDTPEKFKLLRKILGLHTAEERGLTFKSPQALIDANPNQLQEYAVASVVSTLADERIRNALVTIYVQLRERNREAKADEFRSKNEQDAREKEMTEEFEEQQEEERRPVASHL